MRYKFLETLKYSRLYIQPEIFFIYSLIVLICVYLLKNRETGRIVKQLI